MCVHVTALLVVAGIVVASLVGLYLLSVLAIIATAMVIAAVRPDAGRDHPRGGRHKALSALRLTPIRHIGRAADRFSGRLRER